MKDSRILNIENSIHLSVLHYVFLGRINNDLHRWSRAHNSHRVRTEHRRTPLQLWYQGSIQNFHRDITAVNNLIRRDQSEMDGLLREFSINFSLEEPDDIQIVLLRIPLPLTQPQQDVMGISVHAESSSMGIDIYGRVLKYVCRCIQRTGQDA